MSDNREPPTKRARGAANSEDGELCIVHVDGLVCGPFQPLSETRDPEACLRNLKDMRTRRMSQPANSAYRMETSCARIPHELDKNFEYGYHRECYQGFTMNLHRLSPSVDPQPSTSKPKRRSSSDQVLFAPTVYFATLRSAKK